MFQSERKASIAQLGKAKATKGRRFDPDWMLSFSGGWVMVSLRSSRPPTKSHPWCCFDDDVYCTL